MAQFEQRFHGRYHSPGQLITPSELIEMQQLQYKTYCNIEADRYGLNPDGSFTPHVISGLKPSVVAGQHQIKIGRGHGWISGAPLTPYYKERFAIVLEDDLYVDLPAPDGTHPYWCQVYLESLSAGRDVPYGNATVATKGVDGITRNISSPLYYRTVTTTAATVSGTPAASPECPLMGSPYQLPIATVYIGTSDSGAIPAGQLYDVRWFAPGHGAMTYQRGETSTPPIAAASNWPTLKKLSASTLSGELWAIVGVPNHFVFPLIPRLSCVACGSGQGDAPTFADRIMNCRCSSDVGTIGIKHPWISWGIYATPYKTDGSGVDTDDPLPLMVNAIFNPVI